MKAWLKTSFTFKIVIPNLFLGHNLLVKDLIDAKTRSWKEEVLNSLFLPRDIDEIRSIYISSIPVDDILVWHYEHMGIFSVRSAYHMGMEFMEKESQSRSKMGLSSTNKCSLWKKL